MKLDCNYPNSHRGKKHLREWRAECITALVQALEEHGRVILHPLETSEYLNPLEYIAEAEHQDGPEYWLKFSNTREVVEDFERYTEEA